MKPDIRFRGSHYSARSLALQVLADCRQHERFVQEILDRQLGDLLARRLSDADRRLATHLAYGVLRRRGTLNALLQPFVSRRPNAVEPWLWDALHLGAYQLLLLTQVPVHAALYETVELAAQFGRPAAKGFLNGVLRACAGLVTDDWVESPAANALPLEGGKYRRLARVVLPDPDRQPAEYYAKAFGLPIWLARRWLERFGRDEAFRLGFYFAGPAALTLRVNTLRSSREQMLAALQQAGLTASPGELPLAIRLQGNANVRDLPGYAEGWFCVQDESSMKVAAALAPQLGWSILDLCAAPGGKTTHLAELLANQGRILACDIDHQRLLTLRELADRLGLTCIETVCLDARQVEAPAGVFDAVLVDAPCSNTGVLGRRPEARWRLGIEDVRQLVHLQERLLRLAIDRVRPGGVIVYATCSIEPEENGELIQRLTAQGLPWRVEAEEWSRPGLPADGGYWVRLRRL